MNDELEKLKLRSPDWANENIRKLAEIFPNCVTESQDSDGAIKRVIDYDQLRQELSDHIVDGPQERYHLNWPGKREALLAANAPIAKTLRPARDESVNFDTTQNLFIEGDNLVALKLLQETYLGKVKMIYIDPPYNTGNDFIYEDDFAESANEFLERSNQKDEDGNRLIANPDSNGRFHSDWLSMMYSRLKLAKNLLADDGIIFVSIDDGEVSNLKSLCNEIFGAENFKSNFLWKKKSTTSNVKDAQVSSLIDYQLCYGKSELSRINQRIKSTGERVYSKKDDVGNYRTAVIEKKDSGSYKRETMKYKILGHSPREGKRWQIGENKARELETKNRLMWDGEKILLKIYDFEDIDTYSAQPNLLDDHGTSDLGAKLANIELFNIPELFDNPKPIELLKHLISIGHKQKDDLILDFFAGSATTAHAVIQLNAEDGGNRKFIMVQLPEECDPKSEAAKAGYSNIAEISKERIRRVGAKILEGECHSDWNKDIGFRVLKVDTSNMKDVYYRPDEVDQSDLLSSVDNMKPDRTGEDLLFQVLVDWGVDLTLPIRHEKFDNKSVYFVDDDALIACFETGINVDFVKQLATHKPLRVVFRDNGFASDDVKANVAQIFRQTSPDTDIKVI